MPWYWILVIISVIVGPFEAFRAYNIAMERKRKRLEKQEKQDTP